MDSLSSKHPLLILKELEQLFSSGQSSISGSHSTSWSGLGVLVGSLECIIENKYIHEILLPNLLDNLSRVPGSKPWVKGLISVRGQAIPIIDLSAFLFKTKSTTSANTRVLIVNFSDFQSGILIDKSLGLKRTSATKQKVSLDFSATDFTYINEELVIDNVTWPILDISKLGESAEFRNMAGN